MSNGITEWLSKRPKWLQIATNRLIEYGELDDEAISDLATLCRKEVNGEISNIDNSITSTIFNAHDSEEIRLCSISDITGVNKLAPQKPLDFGTSNIAVVYGHNGSGKSGYVRLLKHVCGARDDVRGYLHRNVFSKGDEEQKAKVLFLKGGTPVEYEWSKSGVCTDLSSIDIFDSSFGQVFIGSEDEVSYEPPVLSFISRLIDVSERVAKKLDRDAEECKSKMPNIPESLSGTKGSVWIRNLSAKTTNQEVELNCAFTDEDEREVNEIQKRISETSPLEKAKQLRMKKSYIEGLVKELHSFLSHLSDENCQRIIDLKKKYILKKKVAEASSTEIFGDVKLDGIGSDVWKELWSSARNFSEKYVYSGLSFPNVQNDSVCVLCHQPLSDEAKQRFMSFEAYIKGESQEQAELAEAEMKREIDGYVLNMYFP